MHHGVEAHKALIPDLQGAMNYSSMSDGDLLAQLNGAAHQAVEYHPVLDVAFVTDDDGMRLVGAKGDARADINQLAYSDVAYDRGRIVYVSGR
ncbi:MAG: hypothetical protein NTV25_06105 [Methanothrix sp.]|nr:hypothetical protein [Methanothrix sp.]